MNVNLLEWSCVWRCYRITCVDLRHNRVSCLKSIRFQVLEFGLFNRLISCQMVLIEYELASRTYQKTYSQPNLKIEARLLSYFLFSSQIMKTCTGHKTFLLHVCLLYFSFQLMFSDLPSKWLQKPAQVCMQSSRCFLD